MVGVGEEVGGEGLEQEGVWGVKGCVEGLYGSGGGVTGLTVRGSHTAIREAGSMLEDEAGQEVHATLFNGHLFWSVQRPGRPAAGLDSHQPGQASAQ